MLKRNLFPCQKAILRELYKNKKEKKFLRLYKTLLTEQLRTPLFFSFASRKTRSLVVTFFGVFDFFYKFFAIYSADPLEILSIRFYSLSSVFSCVQKRLRFSLVIEKTYYEHLHL